MEQLPCRHGCCCRVDTAVWGQTAVPARYRSLFSFCYSLSLYSLNIYRWWNSTHADRADRSGKRVSPCVGIPGGGPSSEDGRPLARRISLVPPMSSRSSDTFESGSWMHSANLPSCFAVHRVPGDRMDQYLSTKKMTTV